MIKLHSKTTPKQRDRVLGRFQGDVTNEQFDDWISQFSPDERPRIERLTEHFTYFSANAVNNAVVQLYTRLCGHLGVASLDLTSTWFVPVGYVAKSGSLISYMFRKRNDIPHNRFVSLTDLDVARLGENDTIILLDDFLGSGAQGVDVWTHLSERLPQPIERRLLLGVLIATQRGIARLEHETKLEAVTTSVLDDSDMAFSPGSRLIKNKQERKRVFDIVKAYGARLYPDHPDGFNRSQNLIGFFYSTPNNTLPIYWSTADGWRPLLPRSESFRDPSSLIGPPRFLDRAMVTASADRPIVDMSQLDQLEFEPEVASLVFGEFRITTIALTFGKVLSELGVSFTQIPDLLRVVRDLSQLMHEQKFVPSALAICPDTIAVRKGEREIFTPDVELNLARLEEIRTAATVLSYAPGVLVFNTAGKLSGGYSLVPGGGSADTMVPDSLIELAKFSDRHQAMVFYCSAPGRIHLLYRGHRILLRRGVGWHLQANTLNRAVEELSRQHSVASESIRHAIHLALELSDRGAGAMLTLGDSENVLRFADPPKNSFMKLGAMRIGAGELGPLVSLAAQDGATIIGNDGAISRGMAFLRAPVNTEVEDEIGKGARHSTAARISKVTNALVFAVSSDGRITAYSGGAVKFKVMG